jgi:hypothetical protein
MTGKKSKKDLNYKFWNKHSLTSYGMDTGLKDY